MVNLQSVRRLPYIHDVLLLSPISRHRYPFRYRWPFLYPAYGVSRKQLPYKTGPHTQPKHLFRQTGLVRPPNCSRRIPCPRNLPFHTDCEADGHSTGCLFRPVGGWEQPKEPPTVWHYGLSARYGRSESDVLHSSRIQSNVLPNCYQATDKPAQSGKDNPKNPPSPRSHRRERQRTSTGCNTYVCAASSTTGLFDAGTPFPNSCSYRKAVQCVGKPALWAYGFSYRRRHEAFSSPAQYIHILHHLEKESPRRSLSCRNDIAHCLSEVDGNGNCTQTSHHLQKRDTPTYAQRRVGVVDYTLPSSPDRVVVPSLRMFCLHGYETGHWKTQDLRESPFESPGYLFLDYVRSPDSGCRSGSPYDRSVPGQPD